MKKFLIIISIATLTFFSCESESSNSDLPESETSIEQGPELANLEKSTVLFDGQEITIYMDKEKGEFFSIKNGQLVNIDQLSESGSLGFYVSADFDGFALFSSRVKLDEVLESTDKLLELNQKVNLINGTKSDYVTSEKGSSALAASSGSFDVATSSGLGGFRFGSLLNIFGFPSRYGNPHLRCNQYETGCYNYNDRISSIRLTNAYAEFYTGSFQGFGNWLYINSSNGTYYNSNLSSIGWNDKITAFWVDHFFRASRNITGLPTQLASCSHNYNDPACP
nr:hypothetical protein [uncultured Allomuricauda sp.]